MYNTNYDIQQLKKQFDTSGFAVLDDVLDPTYAEDLYNFLTQTSWGVYASIGKLKDNPPVKHFPKQTRNSDFDYINEYDHFVDTVHKSDFPDNVIWYHSIAADRETEVDFGDHKKAKAFTSLTNGVLGSNNKLYNMVSEITSRNIVDGNIWNFAKFDHECILGPHIDDVTWNLTYILYLSPTWKPEWGGQLCMLDADGVEIDHVIQPKFNRMVIHDNGNVHQRHFILPVSSLAPIDRITATGWFTADV